MHGNHAFDYSARYAEAWYLPDARNLPAGFATEGTFYDYFRDKSPLGAQWRPGQCGVRVSERSAATTMWYRPHLGMTRLNVYAGPAGFYLLRRGPGDLPPAVIPGPLPAGDPAGTRYYEIPLAIRIARSTKTARCSTRTPGSSSMTSRVRTFPDSDSDVPPIWNLSSSPTPWSSMARRGQC